MDLGKGCIPQKKALYSSKWIYFLILEGFLSWDHVWLKKCDWIFMEHPVVIGWYSSSKTVDDTEILRIMNCSGPLGGREETASVRWLEVKFYHSLVHDWFFPAWFDLKEIRSPIQVNFDWIFFLRLHAPLQIQWLKRGCSKIRWTERGRGICLFVLCEWTPSRRKKSGYPIRDFASHPGTEQTLQLP